MDFRPRSQTRFTILPPLRRPAPHVFRNIHFDNRSHHRLLANMQRLRGQVYAADGAVSRNQLTSDGRHRLAIDEHSWHVLTLDARGEVVACLRYLDEECVSHFEGLHVRHAAVAHSPQHGSRFRRAVETEMKQARRLSIGFGEVGGWAVREDHRWTPEPLRIILATYALLELLGSCIGVATATFRHGSAAILQRIGLSSMQADGEEIQPYQDPQYGCLMQVLRFDSRFPNPKYRDAVSRMTAELAAAPVVACKERTAVFTHLWRGVDAPAFVLSEPAAARG